MSGRSRSLLSFFLPTLFLMFAHAPGVMSGDLSIAHTILWNKLDSVASTEASLIGSSFTRVDYPVFRAGVSGKAIGALNDSSRLEMPARAFFGDEPREGTVSLFLKKGMVASVPYQTPLPSVFGQHAYGPDSYDSITVWWGDGVTGPSGINFQLFDSDSITHQATDAAFNTAQVPVGKWVQMMFVWDIRGIQGSADTLRIYRDGNLVGSYSERIADLRASDSPVTVAGSHATSRLPGTVALLIDEIMVFDRAITP